MLTIIRDSFSGERGFKIGKAFAQNIDLFCMGVVNDFYSLFFSNFVKCMDLNIY